MSNSEHWVTIFPLFLQEVSSAVCLFASLHVQSCHFHIHISMCTWYQSHALPVHVSDLCFGWVGVQHFLFYRLKRLIKTSWTLYSILIESHIPKNYLCNIGFQAAEKKVSDVQNLKQKNIYSHVVKNVLMCCGHCTPAPQGSKALCWK